LVILSGPFRTPSWEWKDVPQGLKPSSVAFVYGPAKAVP
jgi:hypothetical protein